MTNFLTSAAKTGASPEGGPRNEDITHGTAFTIAVVEASDAGAVTWTKPDDFEMDSNNPLKGMAGLHPKCFPGPLLPTDRCASFSATIDREVLEGLFSCNGGEAVEGKF